MNDEGNGIFKLFADFGEHIVPKSLAPRRRVVVIGADATCMSQLIRVLPNREFNVQVVDKPSTDPKTHQSKLSWIWGHMLRPDIVVLDLDSVGPSFLDAVRTEAADVPLIVLSNLARAQTLSPKELERATFIQKPLDLGVLRERVVAILSNRPKSP